MIHLQLPSDEASRAHRLPFYLAMEEYAARELPDEYFFMWQVEPTVIFGRNQQPLAELDTQYCRARGIQMYRRRSGGGCVYADRMNIMFSHVADCPEVESTFARFTGAVASMLRDLGIDAAAPSQRNDVMIGSRKVSGYAFYHVKSADGRSRAVVHGTMLYDVDLDTMEHALTPSAAKLAKNGVSSVRQRVTTIREHADISLDDFKAHALAGLCSGRRILSDADVQAIRELEQRYYDPAWLGF